MQIFDYRDTDSENKLKIPKFIGIKYLPLSHSPFKQKKYLSNFKMSIQGL
jgi:hypothetical protein